MPDHGPGWRPPGRVFVNLSGGIDSAYGMWLALSRGIPVVAHHCHLINREGRHLVEAEATRRVMDYLRSVGLKDFTYYESSFDYRTLPRIIYDVELMGWITGMALRSKLLADVSTVMVTANSEDPTARNAQSRRGRIRRESAEMAAYRTLNWWWPFRHMTKSAMVGSMPPGLLECCWWCRKPHNGAACLHCHTCKHMAPILASLGRGEAS